MSHPALFFRHFLSICLTVCCFQAMAFSLQATESRVALVVGNSAYEHIGALGNPRNDALAMAESLRSLGFEVVQGLDLDLDGFRAIADRFSDRLQKGSVGLIYYAGHGVQVDGENYLVPVDAKVERKSHLKRENIPLGELLAPMRDAGIKTGLLFLDACRNNPFPAVQRDVGRGLAPVREVSMDLCLAYAAAPGQTASDGSGQHGVFTGALLKYIKHLGSVEDMLTHVTNEVMELTSDAQRPFKRASLRQPFYFVGPQVSGVVKEMVDPLEGLLAASLANGCSSIVHIKISDRWPTHMGHKPQCVAAP